jgi:putative flippase GtrA
MQNALMGDNNLFKQLARFIVVGVINTGIDLVVLNVLIHISQKGAKGGPYYSIFKGIAFLVALINSYLMNKHWTFAGKGSNNKAIEISEFIIVSAVGFVINVVGASLVINYIPAVAGAAKYWPSFAALCGTAIGLIWNFLGYKLVVFDKNKAV